jgi:hypothetical protein
VALGLLRSGFTPIQLDRSPLRGPPVKSVKTLGVMHDPGLGPSRRNHEKDSQAREDQVIETRSGQAEEQESSQSKSIIKIQKDFRSQGGIETQTGRKEDSDSGSRRGRRSRARYCPR